MNIRTTSFFAVLTVLLFASCGSQKQGGSEDEKGKKKEAFIPSDKLLRSYIKAEQEIMPLRTGAQRDVIDLVSKREMELQRFRELDQAKDPNALEDPITKKEKKVLRKLRKERKKIYDAKAPRMERRAKDKGLRWSQYQRVRDAIRKKGPAQERFKELQDSLGVDLPLPPQKKRPYMP